MAIFVALSKQKVTESRVSDMKIAVTGVVAPVTAGATSSSGSRLPHDASPFYADLKGDVVIQVIVNVLAMVLNDC